MDNDELNNNLFYARCSKNQQLPLQLYSLGTTGEKSVIDAMQGLLVHRPSYLPVHYDASLSELDLMVRLLLAMGIVIVFVMVVSPAATSY